MTTEKCFRCGAPAVTALTHQNRAETPACEKCAKRFLAAFKAIYEEWRNPLHVEAEKNIPDLSEYERIYTAP